MMRCSISPQGLTAHSGAHGVISGKTIALDGKPLAQSKRALVTALRRAENADVKWNAARDSVDDNWGHGPAGVVGLHATLTLPGAPWNIVLLDPSGAPKGPAHRLNGPLEITPADATIWYLLER